MGYVFISSWAHGKERGGISLYRFCEETGEMTLLKTLDEDKSCAASLVDEKRGVLYVLNECTDLSTMRAGGGGEILAYQLDAKTGDFTRLDSRPTYCPNPTQLALDPTGQYMVVANHGSKGCVTKIQRDENGQYRPVVLFDDSVVELLEVREDGSLGEILDAVKHTGEGPGNRQTNAHPHSATMSPSGKLFAVCDKGNDTVRMYQIDRKDQRLVPCGQAVSAPPGSMPRYCVFHPTQPWFYHNNEGSLDVHAYRYEETGQLEWIGAYHGLLEPAEGNTGEPFEQQGLCIDAEGRFVYSVMRGPNRVAVFQVDQADGSLRPIQNMDVPFPWPRGATLSPDGRFLIVSCLKGQKVVVLRVEKDGTLSSTGFEYDHPCAAYATFWGVSM
jgi:6-phosphogluconolactonase (cycloisomerase 2 family)